MQGVLGDPYKLHTCHMISADTVDINNNNFAATEMTYVCSVGSAWPRQATESMLLCVSRCARQPPCIRKNAYMFSRVCMAAPGTRRHAFAC